MSPKRYYLTLSHVIPEEERDTRRSLAHVETWRDGKRAEPYSDYATGSVKLEPHEVARVEAASNVERVEEVGKNVYHVDAAVPSDSDLRSHKADMLFEWGFTGEGIDVGVIDGGIGSAVLSRFAVKATRGFGDASLHGTTDHGSPVASIAVPRQARLVFGAANDTGEDADAIYWMADEVGVHVVNMSFGTQTDSQHFRDALAHAKSKGIELIASAGNDDTSTPQYPANYPGVVCVGALDKNNGWRRASFSNFGPWVDLWMNGVDVAAYDAGGNLISFGGTSAAAPLATFVHASLLTKGLTSLGQINTTNSMRDGGMAREDLGGGHQVNAGQAAWAMRNYCV